MNRHLQENINSAFKNFNDPAYVCNLKDVRKNMEIIKDIKDKTGIKVLIALKGSSLPATWDICREYVDGATSSGLYECKMAKEFAGENNNLEVHTFSPSFVESDIEEILENSDHIVFNSISQLLKYQNKALENNVKILLRLNPEFATVKVDIYNPCKMYSRFGVTRNELLKHLENNPNCLDNVHGIHVHAMCMNRGHEVGELLEHIENNFSEVLENISVVNLGGGHDITVEDYSIDLFVNSINSFKLRNPQISEFYIEPGYGILSNTGYLVAEVVDIVHNGIDIAILNVSASTSSPDVIEYGFRHPINESSESGLHKYLLSSNTCLSGDDWGFYNFNYKLGIGDKILLQDAISYTFVKSTHFNGVKHPNIYVKTEDNTLKLVKQFKYEDFRNRLGE